MILFKHSHSNDTCFLVQTLRSWDSHRSYNLDRMTLFFQELCVQLYTHSYSEALTLSQVVEVRTIIRNLMWGHRSNLSTLTANAIEQFGNRGVPIITPNNTYILNMFKSIPIHNMYSVYTHITRILNWFQENPSRCMSELDRIDLPTGETLNRYVKVGTYLRQIIQNAIISRDSNTSNFEHVRVIPIITIGAYHSEEQIENWRYYIQRAFTREMWEAYATYFGYTLSISNKKFNENKLKDLQHVLSSFTSKILKDREFKSYVNV